MEGHPSEAEERIKALTDALRHVTQNRKSEESNGYRMDRALPVWKAAASLFFAILTATVWVTSRLNNLDQHNRDTDKEVAKVEPLMELVRARVSSDDRLHDAIQKQVEANAKELNSRAPVVDHVQTMWDMLKRGESNKEAFFLEHNYEAPSMIPNRSPDPQTHRDNRNN